MDYSDVFRLRRTTKKLTFMPNFLRERKISMGSIWVIGESHYHTTRRIKKPFLSKFNHIISYHISKRSIYRSFASEMKQFPYLFETTLYRFTVFPSFSMVIRERGLAQFIVIVNKNYFIDVSWVNSGTSSWNRESRYVKYPFAGGTCSWNR